MKTLEEVRAKVLAKVLPDAPHYRSAAEVLVEARAKSAKNVTAYNASQFAHDREVLQHQGLARFQYGSVCSMEDDGIYTDDSDDDAGESTAQGACTLPHKSGDFLVPVNDGPAVTAANRTAAATPTLMAKRGSWRTASTLLGASHRRKSAPDTVEYAQAAAAVAAAVGNTTGPLGGAVRPPDDTDYESWMQRAACLTTERPMTKGKLGKGHLLHLLHNNAGPDAVVAAATGVAPATLEVSHPFGVRSHDQEGQHSPQSEPNHDNSRVLAAMASLRPRPPAAQRSQTHRRSSTASASASSCAAFFSGPQAFSSDALASGHALSGSWSVCKDRTGSGGGGVGLDPEHGAALSNAVGDPELEGYLPSCTSPIAAAQTRFRNPAAPTLSTTSAGDVRSLSRCRTCGTAGSQAASLRCLRVVQPTSPGAASAVASPGSPLSPAAVRTAGPSSPSDPARQMQRSVSYAAPRHGSAHARESESRGRGCPHNRHAQHQHHQHQQLDHASDEDDDVRRLEEALAACLKPSGSAPRVAVAAPAAQGGVVGGRGNGGMEVQQSGCSVSNRAPAPPVGASSGGATRLGRSIGGVGSVSMKAPQRAEDSGVAVRRVASRACMERPVEPLREADGVPPTATGGARRSLDERLLALYPRPTTSAASATALHLDSLQTPAPQPEAPPLPGWHSPSLSRRQSQAAWMGQLPDSPRLASGERSGLGLAVPAAADASERGASGPVAVSPKSAALGAQGHLRSGGARSREASAGGGGQRGKGPGIMARLFQELRDLRRRAEAGDAA